MVDGDRGTGRVGAGVGLVPVRAGDEVHALGPAHDGRVPLDPQQPALRVADRHQVVAVLGEAAEQVAEQRQHVAQRVRAAVVLQLIVVQADRDRGVGVEAAGGAAPPRVGDHLAHLPADAAAAEERVPGAAVLADPLARIGPRGQR
ncbi:hypothetical protein GCM10022255_076540 [Dactylosporangium darangshiense]|uniref:Uncharacterized protein n=1 Tax=Dactylosporangium darangshiense TaxID=579108 RepID=A0ABP8DK21_9ACTN